MNIPQERSIHVLFRSLKTSDRYFDHCMRRVKQMARDSTTGCRLCCCGGRPTWIRHHQFISNQWRNTQLSVCQDTAQTVDTFIHLANAWLTIRPRFNPYFALCVI